MLEFIISYKTYLLAIAAALFFVLETFRPLFESLPEARGRHILRNFLLTGFNFVLLGVGYAVALVAVVNFSESIQSGLFYQVEWPSWIELLLILLILDLALYLWHVASHKIPFLWRFHQVHHSDLILDFSSATRFHVGELAISAVIRLGLVVLLGAGLLPILIFEFFVVLCAQFNHSNLRLPKRFEPLLRILLVTPEMHHIHHSDKPIETDSNYCTTISIWDYIFRTFRWRADISDIHIGLKQYRKKESVTLWKIIIMPFKK
jgi:sterol desaturase/sphingolipid hydroxylase (fatty acid hydroxylase superfamily)